MRNRTRSFSALGLAYLLCIGAASWSLSASAQTAPTVTTGLRVNGVNTGCGATVASGDQVCLLFSSNQGGTVVISIQKGSGTPTVIDHATVHSGETHSVCVTAGTADGIARHFIVNVTNASGHSSTASCSYVVGGTSGQTVPVVTTALKVNGVTTACGARVASGDQVCLLFSSNQDATAVVTIRKGTGAKTVLAKGTVQAGRTYKVCVTAGVADGLIRTFTVKVTNASGRSAFQSCSYVVGGTSGQTVPVVTTALRVNGVTTACGATVASGAEVCVLLSSNQDGTAVVSIQKGTGTPTVLDQGTVQAGRTYRVCVTAGAADGLLRRFIVTVTNAAGQTGTQTCSYAVQ